MGRLPRAQVSAGLSAVWSLVMKLRTLYTFLSLHLLLLTFAGVFQCLDYGMSHLLARLMCITFTSSSFIIAFCISPVSDSKRIVLIAKFDHLHH